MIKQAMSITEVNEYIRSKMDADSLLANIAVRGEISNYKMYPSGHHYFTLKDEGAALKCVMFRSSAVRLQFRPENGMQVVAVGKISVYPRDGAYQLYATGLILDGVGDLYAAFEQLKTKLAAQGLFDPAHKKPLPAYPQTIGIITSSAGAAVHDILRILNRRYPLAHVKLLPVRVQGAEAPEEISAAIAYANYYKLADLLIVGRGGGSIEDLWAFNDERVAHAIYRSEIPVISAVGHEPDVTISDYVADRRAATPSNAAEIAVPDRETMLQSLDAMQLAMTAALSRQLKEARRGLDLLAKSPALQAPESYIAQRRKSLELLDRRMTAAQSSSISYHDRRYRALTTKLDALSPLKVLSRGYAMVQTGEGHLVRSVKQLAPGDTLAVTLSDGRVQASVTELKEETL